MKVKFKKLTQKQTKVKRGRTYKIEKTFYRIIGSFDASDAVNILQAVNGRNNAPG
jgi:hypothetical protein